MKRFKIIYQIFLLFIIVLFSCSSTVDKKDYLETNQFNIDSAVDIKPYNETNIENKKPHSETTIENEEPDKLLLSNKKYVSFNIPKQDSVLFKLEHWGQSISTGYTIFTISNNKEKELYLDTLKPHDFYNNIFETDFFDLDSIEQNEFVIGGINRFFNEKQFRRPAIPKDYEYSDFSESYTEFLIWNALKADTNSVSFYYQLGDRGTNGIAYSKIMEKIIVFYKVVL